MQIILGGGCFWCLQGCFDLLPFVNSVICGYSGGLVSNPTYEQVCSGKTGHAEVILIDYNENSTNNVEKTEQKSEEKNLQNMDNSQNKNQDSVANSVANLVTNSSENSFKNDSNLDKILNLFWQIHDPTTLNRQGADVGSQYASVIFWETWDQLEIIKQNLEKLEKSGKYSDQIVTKIEEKTIFWQAEEKHQNYFENNPSERYCQLVILPKIQKTKQILNANN